MCAIPELNDDPNIALGELADLVRRGINAFETKHQMSVTDVTIARQDISTHGKEAHVVNVAIQAAILRQTFNFDGEPRLVRKRS